MMWGMSPDEQPGLVTYAYWMSGSIWMADHIKKVWSAWHVVLTSECLQAFM